MMARVMEGLLIIIIWTHFSQSSWTYLDLLGGKNSDRGLLRTGFKYGRMNKTTYVVNGFYNITKDFSNAYDIEIKAFYSTKGNNQFSSIVYGIPRTPLCNYINSDLYRTKIHPDYQAFSDLPEAVPDEPLCPLYKKGSYKFSNWPMVGTAIPQYMNAGYYRLSTYTSHLSGTYNNKMATIKKSPKLPLSRQLKILTTAAIFFGNITFGCSITSFYSVLENMRSKYSTTIEDISIVLSVSTILYCMGAIACNCIYYSGGVISKRINRQLIAIGSLLGLAFSHYMAPHCPTKIIFFVIGGVLGTSLGFYDSTQMVWIIEIWQEASGPFIQTQHFCYAIGTIISPLVIAPFLNTNDNIPDNTTISSTSSFASNSTEKESNLYIPFTILGVFISLALIFQIFLFMFYRYRTPPMYANENFKQIDDANNTMLEMEQSRPEIVSNNQQEYNETMGISVRKVKLVAVTTIFIGAYLAMEVSTMQFIPIFGQYSNLKMTESASAYMLTALTGMFAIGRAIGIIIIFKVRPELIICINLIFIVIANSILLLWASGNLTMFWIASILLGIGQSTTYPSFCAFMEKYLVFTSAIASLVVVVATVVGAVYPLIIGSIIERNVIVLTYTNYFSTTVCIIVMAIGYKLTRNSRNRAR